MDLFAKLIVAVATAAAMLLIAFIWLSQPLEVYEASTGECLYQLKATGFGFGEEAKVPCGTFGELAVQRISSNMM